MTDEEKRMIYRLRQHQDGEKYFDMLKSEAKLIADLIWKKDKTIKAMAKELTNLIDEDVDTIIKRFEEEN